MKEYLVVDRTKNAAEISTGSLCPGQGQNRTLTPLNLGVGAGVGKSKS